MYNIYICVYTHIIYIYILELLIYIRRSKKIHLLEQKMLFLVNIKKDQTQRINK